MYKIKINFKNILFFKVKILIILFFCFFYLNKASAGMLDVGSFGDSLSGPSYGFTDMGSSILVEAPKTDQSVYKLNTDQNKAWYQSFWDWAKREANSLSYAKAFWAAARNAFNTIAYDTATWIGSGGDGQKPLFVTESWGVYLTNVADNAAGTFIETLGQSAWDKFNLCEPDILVKAKIGLGLARQQRPGSPACTFSEMINNWEEELQSDDFLFRFQDMFNPFSNDLGIALTLHTNVLEEKAAKQDFEKTQLIGNGGYINPRDIAGNMLGLPTKTVTEKELETMSFVESLNLTNFTNTAVDAANIFLNQLAITAFNNFLKNLAKDSGSYSSPYSGDYGLLDANAQKSTSGASGLKDKLRQLTQPSFGVRGDYNILAELASCPNPNKAGPTNCVITEKFRQAISEKKTVGRAMQEGYLNSSGIFGFTIGNNLEPSYNDENYPYRSMIILRKFRILPVGWELAAQYIKENSNVGTRNLGDLVACFDSNDEYEGYEQNWCRGMVDPNWVLKAPLNYCKREGPGPEILSEQISGAGADSELSISRNENYCADEQSCIKENSDGSCQMYGYCTEERRIWNSGAQACEPINNSCQTFRGSDGSTASYLQNTLDYGDCSADYAGCTEYSLTGSYNSSASLVNWSTFNTAYFDGGAKTCSADGEGCHEFIRAKTGVNLIANAGFENSDLSGTIWSGASGSISNDAFEGENSFELSGDFVENVAVGPSDYVIGGESFVLSFYAKDCGTGGQIMLGDAIGPLVTSEIWGRYSLSYTVPSSELGNTVQVGIGGFGATCLIDSVKLEFGITGSAYADYGTSGLVYQKLIPSYLEDSCYENPGIDYRLKNDAPAECGNFTRECNADEEGCELYTSLTDSTSVPAKAVAQDYCPGECVGYDTYIQGATVFDSLRDSYFIPSTAGVCQAQAVGCDEFTNLDKVEKGGEGIEYYSYLRQCIKPNAGSCSEFYTWEGSDETGYQLKVVQLKKDALNNPDVVDDDSLECDAIIYNLPSTDPSYNPDCREFYNTSGEVSYHLMSYTISCSENCYPFRRSKVNTDPAIASMGACGDSCSTSASDGDSQCWDDKGDSDSLNDECVVCKGGGTWDSEARACIFMAVPNEGITCSAANSGCREYTGNAGNNVEVVLNNNFEGSRQGWTAIGSASAELSSEALTAGGNSLLISNTSAVADNSRAASTTVGFLVEEGKSYKLQFIAKPSTVNGFTVINSIVLSDNAGNTSSFASNLGKKSDTWQIYEVNLASLDHNVGLGESLEIWANGNIYIDDVKLTEITDRYYLIQNSWTTPESCDQDNYGNPYPLFMLGCDAYSDRGGNTHYLHSFSSLCQDSAVGCELMIDTENSSNYASENFGSVTVPADEFKYIVYDESKQCNSGDKGCSRLGKAYQYDGSTVFSDIYLKNNPDEYNSILCSSDNVGCKEWSTGDGISYFKDPGDEVCEWRQAEGQSGYDWYRKKIKRCDGDGDVCLSDSSCSSGETCQTENADVKCPTNYLKTIGYGGNGNAVFQPDSWAGMCSASDSGCTELIDPVSRAETNIVFNADFSQDVDENGIPDGWEEEIGPVDRIAQDIVLEPNTLYVLAVNGSTEVVVSGGSLYELDNSNNFSAGSATISVWSDASNNRASKRFYTSSGISSARIRVVSDETMEKVELKKAIISYGLNSGLDKSSCNGLVNFEDGCVLFNERAQNGSSLNGLTYDADLTINDGQGVSPSQGLLENRDANTILKVQPDRVCNQWLACRSMAAVEVNGKEENVCYDIGLCNSVDESGNCNGFAITSGAPAEQTSNLNGDTRFGNTSGYSKVGYGGISDWSMKGDYEFGKMEQIGEISNFSNGGFEFYGSNNYPTAWIVTDSSGGGLSWEEHMMKVINNPISAQYEGVDYAPEGRSFLKMGAGYRAESEYIEVVDGEEYILTSYINTKNLNTGSVKVNISTPYGLISSNPEISLDSGNGWVFKLGKFTASDGLIKIIIKVEGADVSGNYYIDDIKLRPALEARNDWYVPQSCRLYPENDSLSCEYYNESGQYSKGWYGYCLEYDRAPGDPNACLMWWPVERVKGDGVEEGAGYDNRVPLYYCSKFSAKYTFVEYRRGFQLDYTDSGEAAGTMTCSGCGCAGNPNCPAGYISYHHEDSGWSGSEDWYGCNVNTSDCYTTDGSYWVCNYNGDLQSFSGPDNSYDEADIGIRLYDESTGEIIDMDENAYPFYCSEVVQAVTPIGQNKYWSGRVYEGSNYAVPILYYNYDSGYKPFGGLTNPSPSNNPYEWDSVENTDSNLNVQPLYVQSFSDVADYGESYNAGSPYSCEGSNCSNAGICVDNTDPTRGSRKFCYNFNVGCSAPASSYSVAMYTCPTGETCQTPFNASNGTDLIKRIFAQGYGSWYWDGNPNDGRYRPTSTSIWTPPTNLCSGGIRPNYVIGSNADFCAILPQVTSIEAGGSSSNLNLTKTGFVNLTFNAAVDSNQLPLVMYAVDWGDDEGTTVSGVEMRDRQNADNPFSLYHLYDYWDLKAKDSAGSVQITCGSDSNGSYCETKPRIRIKDNWGWCNGGTAMNDCDQWEEFAGVVRVYEK